MRRWSSRRTTTGPTAGCSMRTTARSPTRATCRSSSTTSRRRTGHERRRGHVPAARRASAGRRGQGGQRQPRADRPDLPRAAARRRGPRRRRRLDPADPRDGRRRRRVRRLQRDPRRARGPLRGGRGRRLGHGPPDPRALAAALPRQLPRRPEPRAGEGRPRADGPARHATPSAPRSCRSTRTRGPRWRSRSARSGCSRPPAAGWRASMDQRGRRMTAETELAPRPPTTAIDPSTLLDDLEAGRLRAAEPDPTPPDGWRVRPDVKAAILACFGDRTTQDLVGRAADVPRPRRRPAARPRRRAVADRARRHGRPARRPPRRRRRRHAAVLREHRGVGRRRDDGRFARPRRLVRADRRAGPPRPPASRSAGCSSPPAPARSSSRTRRSSGPGSALLDGVLVRTRRRHRGRRDPDRDVAHLRPRPRAWSSTGTDGPPAGRARRRGRRARCARSVPAPFAAAHGLSASVALLVKDRDAGTSARVALEDALR